MARSRLLSAFDGWNRLLPTMGRLGHGAFLIALLSGVVLVLPYDVRQPYLSLQEMTLGDPGSQLFRSLHYWSGQLCLILVGLHLIEHLAARSERLVPPGLWLRLVLSMPLLLLLLLTGFMLRGDAEGLLARQVSGGLLESLPGVGSATSLLLLGSGDDLQVVYAHHVGLLTVLVLLALVEHARPFWPTWPAWLLTLSGSSLLAVFRPPDLHLSWDPVVKGPWYFLGLQELLHWASRPGWVVLSGIILLTGTALMPRMGERATGVMRWVLVALTLVYAVLTVVAWLFRGPGWVLTKP